MADRKKTVVITGASSGIGRSCASTMSAAGWHVIATVRKAADAERLQAEFPGVAAALLDVEDQASIVAAAQQAASLTLGEGLDGLVNVAGIGMVRPLEFATQQDIRQIFEINVFGQISVTQAFSGLLRQARGRIVNITSVGVNIAIPFGGLLNASKSAFALLSDTMRLEMHPFGVWVSAVEPGAISTPAVEKTLGDIEQVIASLPPDGQAEYGSMLRNFARKGYAREKKGSGPEVVARAVHHALTSSRPRIRYRVGKHAKLLTYLAKTLPEALLDRLRLKMFDMPTAVGGDTRGAQTNNNRLAYR